MLFNVLFYLSIITSACFQSINVTEVCGKRPIFNQLYSNPKIQSIYKIINGNISIVGDWAWTVSLTTSGRHFCGGVLINSEYVLSAAHCFLSNNVNPNFKVVLGVHNIKKYEQSVQTRSFAKLFRHEQYNQYTLRNDIALIKLDKPVDFNDYVLPACIDEKDEFLPEGKESWLTGWGDKFYQSGRGTDEKNLGRLNINTISKCKQIWGSNIDVNSQICGGQAGVNAGACQGDSGGPMVQQAENGDWYLSGLVSWGIGCGDGTIFTRVKYFLPWIRSKM